MRRTIRFPSWDGPRTDGQIINAALPTGGERLISATLALGSGTGSKVFSDFVDEIRFLVDGRTVIFLKGSQYAYITEFNGSAFHKRLITNKYQFTHHFAQPWRRDAVGEDAMGWGTNGVGSIQMQLKLVASVPETLLLTGTLDVDGVVDERGRAPGIGNIQRIEQMTIPFAAAGAFTWPVPMRRFPLHRIHVFSDKVNSVEVWWRGKSLYYSEKENAVTKQTQLGLNPTSTVFTIPFDRTQRIQDLLDVREPGEFRLDFDLASGVAASQVVFEGIGGPEL